MGTVSLLLAQCKAGDEDALRALCGKYWGELTRVARQRFGANSLRSSDEDDAVNNAFFVLWSKARDGELADLTNSAQLHAWLSTVVANRVIDRIRSEHSKKAGGDRRSDIEILEELGRDESISTLERLVLEENLAEYIGRLPEPLRPFAELHLAGFTQNEIASRLNRSRRTVIRHMKIIHELWTEFALRRGDI